MHIMGIVDTTIMARQSNRPQPSQNSLDRNRFFFYTSLASAPETQQTLDFLTPVDAAMIDAGADGVRVGKSTGISTGISTAFGCGGRYGYAVAGAGCAYLESG